MKKLIQKQIKEIREWRSAVRRFKATPDNVSAFENRETQMLEYIDILLEIVERNPNGE